MEFKEFDIKLYFSKNYGMGEKPSEGANGLKIFFGVIVLIIGIIVAYQLIPTNEEIGWFLAVILVAVGLALALPSIFTGAKNKMRAEAWQAEFDHRRNTWDSEFDKFYQNKVDEMNLKQTAMLKIGIIEEQCEDIQPFFIRSYFIKGAQNWFRVDENGAVRADYNEITWLFFSKEQLYLYSIKFRLTTLEKEEFTQEFFYQDIVSITIATEQIALDAKNCLGGDVAKVAAAERLKLSVPGDRMNFVLNKGDHIAESILTIKNKIRDAKSANRTKSAKKKTIVNSKKSDQ